MLKNAVALIKVGETQGTGYLVSKDFVATCSHVVRSAQDSTPINVIFENRQYSAMVFKRNEPEDCAILKLDSPVEGITPFRLSRNLCNRGDTWEGFGFPAKTLESGHWLTGDVQDPNGRDYQKSQAVVLYAREFAAGSGAQPQGFSGSPVLVGNVVVGHLKRIIPDSLEKNEPVRAALGTVYATPVQVLLDMLPAEFKKPLPKPQPPVAGYDPTWYINRDEDEENALNSLGFPGAPVVLWGPAQFGKTTTLKYLLDQIRNDVSQPSTIATINLMMFDQKVKDSLDTMLREFANQLVVDLFGNQNWVEITWQTSLGSIGKMKQLMEKYILPNVTGRLVLAIDQVDAIWKLPYKNDFFGMLRNWTDQSNEEVWGKLRLVLTISMTPSFLVDDVNQSVLSMANMILLGDFNPEQVEQLAKRYDLNWTRTEIEKLMNLVGGHPYLIRVVMYKARLSKANLDELLDLQNPKNQIFKNYLDRFRYWLNHKPELQNELRSFKAGNVSYGSNPILCERLSKVGLLTEVSTSTYRLRYPLYEALID